jgi:hypothetical protein
MTDINNMQIIPPRPVVRQNKIINYCSCKELIKKWGFPRSAVKCKCGAKNFDMPEPQNGSNQNAETPSQG